MSELLDANKTPLTIAATSACMTWMAERGFKPLATEVPIKDGWVADVAGMAVLQRGEAQKMKLIPSRPQYRGGYEEGWADTPQWVDHKKRQHDWEAAYLALPCPFSTLIEVKVSRADFLKDRVRKFSEMPCHANYIATPTGMLSPEEYPEGWGVLLVSASGDRIVKCAKVAPMGAPPQSDCLWLAWNLAVKLDHDERYAKLRQIQKRGRIEHRNRQTVSTIRDAAYVLRDLVKGRENITFQCLSEDQQAILRAVAEELKESR